uniref:L-Fucosyltransferase n=1 Tax=Hirondellea gigas TaxID=1518452 RepID=A0A6A7G5W9_9CRUS
MKASAGCVVTRLRLFRWLLMAVLMFVLVPTLLMYGVRPLELPMRRVQNAWMNIWANCSTVEPRQPIITFIPTGRLGNQICEYAHLFMIHKTYNVAAAIHPEMLWSFGDMFADLSLTPVMKKQCLRETDTASIEEFPRLPTRGGITKNLLFVGTPCCCLTLWEDRDIWREELQISRRMKIRTKKRINEMISSWQGRQRNKSSNTQLTVIGVHVRRGDYGEWLRSHYGVDLMSESYYKNAFQYYRDRFGSVLFLVLSEPYVREWCQHHLERNSRDVYVVRDNGSPEEDIALLASVHHFIYSHGTFGLWGIFLADVQSVAYPRHNDTYKQYAHHHCFDEISLHSNKTEFVTIQAK